MQEVSVPSMEVMTRLLEVCFGSETLWCSHRIVYNCMQRAYYYIYIFRPIYLDTIILWPGFRGLKFHSWTQGQ